MTHICQFCQQPAQDSPIPGTSTNRILLFFCHPCQAEYLVWTSSNKQSSVSLYTTIDNKLYRLTTTDYQSTLSYIQDPGIPGQKRNKNIKTIKCFEQLEDINPKNINEKIKLFITFS